ncbi:MAG TPA: tail fiber domain-containing protein [Candidatus Angelobacter sp.]|nr:tail fiber domain-containing protein [Candidatus Angelobacter sp.]
MATKSFYPRLALLLLTSLFLGVQALTSQAQATAFTYQGRFNDGGTAANGTYDFSFRLATDPAANNYVGGTVLTNGVPIANGLFTVTLDFGPGLFVGSNYWLEVDARTNGATAFTTLSPRQAVTPAPYAIMANSASNLLGNLPAGQVSGPLANANLPANPTFSGTVTATSLTGNGANVSSVNALALNGLNATNFWQTGGNNVGNGQFLGSTNNQSVEVRVNRQRAILIIPTAIDAPNIIGGAPVNVVDAGIKGAVIAGGGTTNFLGVSSSNRISADFSAIVGGSGNSIQAGADHAFIGSGWNNTVSNSSYQSVISGGQNNSIAAIYSVIGGGLNNVVPSGSTYSTVGGGDNNVAGGANAPGYSVASTVAGGESNSALQPYATIAGGLFNTNSAFGAAIGGGSGNLILPDYNGSAYATIGGGWNNWNFALEGTISGGRENIINTNGAGATIAGGVMNNIAANNFPGTYNGSVIGGGLENTNNGNYSTVSGGVLNTIQFGADGASVGGGSLNTIYTNANHSVISGGANNSVLPGAIYSSLGGGQNNSIQTNANYSTIGGGQNNSINSGINTGTIGGGLGNVVSGLSGTVAGGENNQASAFRDAVGGGILNSASGGISTVAGGWTNTASGNASSIGGGDHNLASGLESVISGGSGNQATNIWAAIPGGQNNVAGGAYSFAAGQRAKATNDGAFVWADATGADFTSTNANSFNVRAVGGIRFLTGGAGLSLDNSAVVVNNNSTAVTVNGSFKGDGSGLTNVWQLGGNNISPGQFIGSINNEPVEIWANNQRVFRIEPAVGVDGAPNIIGGLAYNSVFGSAIGAVIGGGTLNTVSNDYPTIAGGAENISDGYASTVAGGYFNYATNDFATVAGGGNNIASSLGATIGGGSRNEALASESTASGGFGNIASGVGSTIAGGGYDGVTFGGNFATASASAIGGGIGNHATGDYSTVPGGENNVAAGFFSFAAGQRAKANHQGAFVWADSQAADFASTAANQFLVRAAGGVGINTSAIIDNDFCINTNTYLFSHAIYLRGETGSDHHHGLAYCGNGVTNFGTVLPDGPVLWGFGGGALGSSNPTNHSVLTWDNIGVSVSSTAQSQNSEPELTVTGLRQGGFGTPVAYVHNNYSPGILAAAPALRVVNDGTSLDGALSVSTQGTGLIAEFGNASSFVVTIKTNGTVVANGVTLTSDRNAKENFTDVNPESILEKVASLPMSEWNYKIDDAAQKHIGPMAQDFHAAFGLDGADDKHISVVDEGGVALAAIQGLNQKLNEKDAEIQKLKTENETLAARLNDLEAAVKSLANNRP